MKKFASIFALAASLALLALTAMPAFAADTVFLTDKNANVRFPFSPPNRATGAGGAIDNMIIGATTPRPVTGSTLKVDNGTKTATATAGAATLNKNAGTITTESLTTAAAATYTLTITDNQITATDQVMASLTNGTNSAGSPDIILVTPGAGSLVITVQNVAAAAAFNGTLKISFVRFVN
jgi:hypothetical protein